MGGGDLNMKKSWHPLLMKNQERVWKEERKALDERKKTAQLQKELAEERQLQELQRIHAAQGGGVREERVDWLYATPAAGAEVNAEEQEAYLLGKKTVDKFFKEKEEIAAKLAAKAASQADADQPGGGFISLQNANTLRDTAAKIREDPLLAIKQQEQLAYEALRKNPDRLKALQTSVKPSKDLRKQEKDKVKRHQRDDKERKRHRQSEKDSLLASEVRDMINRSNREHYKPRETAYDRPHARRHFGSPDRHTDHRHRSHSPDTPHRRSRTCHGPYRARSPSPAHYSKNNVSAGPKYNHSPDSSLRKFRHRTPPYNDQDHRSSRRRSRSPSPLQQSSQPRVSSGQGETGCRYTSAHEIQHTQHHTQHSATSAARAGNRNSFDHPSKRIPLSKIDSEIKETHGQSCQVAKTKTSEAQAARLAQMQASAKALNDSRSDRLKKLEAEDQRKLALEQAERERNRIKLGGVGEGIRAKFVRDQEKKVFFGEMELGERVKRSGGVGLLKDRE